MSLAVNGRPTLTGNDWGGSDAEKWNKTLLKELNGMWSHTMALALTREVHFAPNAGSTNDIGLLFANFSNLRQKEATKPVGNCQP